MKFLYAIAGVGAVAGGVHYTGVLDRGEVYDKPYSVVYAELVSMPLPPQAQDMFQAEVKMTQAPDRIDWRFSDRRGEIAVFSAHLTREDLRHTRVKVDFHTSVGLDDESDRLISTDLIRSTARSAMAEQLDARLSGRPFDNAHMAQILGDHLRDHPEALKQYGETISQIYKDVGEQMKAESTFSYESIPEYRSATTQQSMDAATRPAVDLPTH